MSHRQRREIGRAHEAVTSSATAIDRCSQYLKKHRDLMIFNRQRRHECQDIATDSGLACQHTTVFEGFEKTVTPA